jgi:hypothetical protein
MELFSSRSQMEIFKARLQFWRPRKKLNGKFLICYKDYQYDHALYSLLMYFRANYKNVELLGFSGAERPRENPGLSSKKLKQKIEQFKPDTIFVYEKILSPGEIDYVLNLGIKLITSTCGYTSYSYGGMSPVDGIKNLARHALYLVPHAPHISTLRSFGVNAVEFPFWYEPAWFYPQKHADKRFDLLFFGDFSTPLNKNRLGLVETLAKKYKIAVASNKSIELPNIHYLGSTTDPLKLNEWINFSRLVMGSDRLAEKNFTNNGIEPYLYKYDDEFFIRQRTFITLGAGACYFVEKHPEVERKFTGGREIVLWENQDDLMEKIDHYLTHPSEREVVGNNAFIKSQAAHTTIERANELARML